MILISNSILWHRRFSEPRNQERILGCECVPSSPFCSFRLSKAYEKGHHHDFLEHVGKKTRELRNYYVLKRLDVGFMPFFSLERQLFNLKSMVFSK
jgi:hypothetical protein